MKLLHKFTLVLAPFILFSCGKKDNNNNKDNMKITYSHSQYIANQNYNLVLKGQFTDQCQANVKYFELKVNTKNEINKILNFNLKKVDECKLIINEVNINQNEKFHKYFIPEILDVELEDSTSSENTRLFGNNSFPHLDIAINYINGECNITVDGKHDFFSSRPPVNNAPQIPHPWEECNPNIEICPDTNGRLN
ncbi:hypothetical protein [Pigmentibacter ruber]|uniref:hypothetical protein n=1 Tax=Pigmentibacter ruber TaxID=2683196 RepID=UPI00131A7C4E|nr:hypothetical protein [Pigmentibacter ruber]